MKKENTEKKVSKMKKENVSCADNFCPIHGNKRLKIRGRTFEGNVIRKFPGRVTIEFNKVFYIRKYERYEKRKTKIHARLPDCMKDSIEIGNRIKIGETRPISKTIHFVVIGKVGKEEGL